MPTRRPFDASTTQTAPPDLLTVAETGAVLRCGLTFVYESIHRYRATGDADEIPGLKVGRSRRVPRVQLERHIGAPITWPIVDHPTVDHEPDTTGPVDTPVQHPFVPVFREEVPCGAESLARRGVGRQLQLVAERGEQARDLFACANRFVGEQQERVQLSVTLARIVATMERMFAAVVVSERRLGVVEASPIVAFTT